MTDSSGAFVLDLLPLGRWTITMHHPGFGLGLANIDLSRPGDTLTVVDVHLVSDPALNARQVRAAEKVVGHLDGIFRAEVRTKRSGGKL